MAFPQQTPQPEPISRSLAAEPPPAKCRGYLDHRNPQRLPQTEPISGPPELAASLDRFKARLNRRRRERIFGRPSGLSPQWERPR
jgi:hypothetical protein